MSDKYAWTQQSGLDSLTVSDVVCSDDGNTVYAHAYIHSHPSDSTYIYKSIDGGIAFTPLMGLGEGGWGGLACSSDGMIIAVGENQYNVPGYIHTSVDGGNTWITQTGSGIRHWNCLAMSADGKNIAAAVSGSGPGEEDYIYTSGDYGVHWIPQTNSGLRKWHSIASSADGKKLIAVVYPGFAYTSIDSGVTWHERLFSAYWHPTWISANGEKMIVGISGGYLYVSDNDGITWNERASSTYWSDIAGSSEGSVLIAVVDGGNIYASIDGGVDWGLEFGAPAQEWTCCDASSDGSKIVVGVRNGGNWTGAEIPNSSSSSSSTSESTSSLSQEAKVYGLTYYSDFREINAVNNPIMGSDVQMQFYGFFDKDWQSDTLTFDNFGYGLKKTFSNQGMIYCHDSSQLFSMNKGCVGMVLSLPQNIVKGVYAPLKDSTLNINEYILWGTNVGKYECGQMGFYAALTPNGIEFTIANSETYWTITDTITDVSPNTDVYLQFAWGHDYTDYQIDSDLSIMGIFINGVNTVLSNPPMGNDNLANLKFYVLNNPFSLSNLECTIKKLVIYNKIPTELIRELNSSSSSSDLS